jgi:hypothetical protein
MTIVWEAVPKFPSLFDSMPLLCQTQIEIAFAFNRFKNLCLVEYVPSSACSMTTKPELEGTRI